MISAPKPQNEAERLEALRAYELLDTMPEAAFDAMTKLAANICGTPIAAVSLIDENRQWFKSQYGLDGTTSTDRNIAFCAHVILQDGIFEVPDASVDPRFGANPLVTGYPHIRFYAGMPLIDPKGMALGTICVIDRRPRKLTQTQREQLQNLGQAIVGLITTRIRRSEIEEYRRALSSNKITRSRLKKRFKLIKTLTNSIVLVDRLTAKE